MPKELKITSKTQETISAKLSDLSKPPWGEFDGLKPSVVKEIATHDAESVFYGRGIAFLDQVQIMKKFDYSLDFANLNFRDRPELYRIGRGEQGVLLVEPYKSEILPNWRFRTPEIATESSNKI